MNKPLLVFIPGTLCDHRVFQPINEHLSTFADTLFIDFQQESSLLQMCQTVLAKVKDRPFIPVGFSMGGFVAFELIRQATDQIQALILLSSNSHADVAGRAEGRQQQLALATQQGLTSLMKDVYLPVYFSEPDSEHAELVLKMAEDLGLDCFEKQIKVLAQRPDSLETLKTFSHPVLLISGENDLPCPPSQQKRMVKACQNAELHILPDSGHFALLEQSKTMAQLIKNWGSRN